MRDSPAAACYSGAVKRNATDLRLAAGLTRLTDGVYDQSITVRSRDELGAMAQAFNAMNRGLAEKEKIRSLFNLAVSREITEEMLRSETALQGELREVMVLFSDIRGFTALFETLTPTHLVSMINVYYSVMAPIVAQNGGVVDKYVGDEILAIFGAPVRAKDAAAGAVTSALRMQQALVSFNAGRRKRGLCEIAFGVGINSGPVVAGDVGSSDGLNSAMLGPAVKEGHGCAPGEILVSESAWRQVRDRFAGEELPPIQVKG